MPLERRSSPPSYRLHKASGQAIVTLDGKLIYLGTHGSAESRAKYDHLLSAWLTKRQSSSTPGPKLSLSVSCAPANRTISEVILAFARYGKGYYSAQGREYEQSKPVLRVLRECCGDVIGSRFGPERP